MEEAPKQFSGLGSLSGPKLLGPHRVLPWFSSPTPHRAQACQRYWLPPGLPCNLPGFRCCICTWASRTLVPQAPVQFLLT